MTRKIKRGDIVYYDFGPNNGSVQGGMRPAVVLQNDTRNKQSPTTIVAPLTTELKKLGMYSHIVLGKRFGLKQSSMILLEQLVTVNQASFGDYIGTIDDQNIRHMINVGLRKVLAIQGKPLPRHLKKIEPKDGSYLEHPGLKPPGAKGYFRFRSLGPDYDYDSIRRRIIENTLVPGMPFLIEKNSHQRWDNRPDHDLSGLPGKYQRYCIRLYAYISRPTKKEYIPMALREDIAKLDRYIEQLDYLYQNRIESGISLETKKTELKRELGNLIIRRRKLYSAKKRAVRSHDAQQIEAAKADIRAVSKDIRELKKQISLCESITVSSERVAQGLEAPTKKPEVKSVTAPPIKKKNRS